MTNFVGARAQLHFPVSNKVEVDRRLARLWQECKEFEIKAGGVSAGVLRFYAGEDAMAKAPECVARARPGGAGAGGGADRAVISALAAQAFAQNASLESLTSKLEELGNTVAESQKSTQESLKGATGPPSRIPQRGGTQRMVSAPLARDVLETRASDV